MPRTDRTSPAVDRRAFLRLATGAIAGAASTGTWLPLVRAADMAPLAAWPKTARFPEKGDLLLLTDKPPNLEMPLRHFREDITPNEYFYVRWHLGILPTRIDTTQFRLSLAGHVDAPLSLSLDDLRKNYEPVSVVAVNQCSGNSRSLYEPRMPGVQWGNGAIGNARWTGVRLRDLLAKAKVKAGAVDVSFGGLDEPTLPAAPNFAGTPDFVKSLPFDRANDGEVMVAYEMNGQPLPMLNGFPLRLVVPGWYATYWVKALNEITVLDKPFEGFWVAKAYRVPNTPDFQETPKALAKETIPINRMTVRSLFVRPEPDEAVTAGAAYEVQGLALDGGSGIKSVEVSTDGGNTWSAAKLDRDLGKYSWRRWRFAWQPQRGNHRLMARAVSNAGEKQTNAQWNRSGYARNVIESVDVKVG
jgi:DMSO/TMAO reductase YedYZ molybdopterin-dependent catalytic subunit